MVMKAWLRGQASVCAPSVWHACDIIKLRESPKAFATKLAQKCVSGQVNDLG